MSASGGISDTMAIWLTGIGAHPVSFPLHNGVLQRDAPLSTLGAAGGPPQHVRPDQRHDGGDLPQWGHHVVVLWTRCGEVAQMASPSLTRLVKPKGHAALRTVDDVCGYVISLPRNAARTTAWETVAHVAFNTLSNRSESALDELTHYIELALFVSHRLDPSITTAQMIDLVMRQRERGEQR
jgi:hypothetical protein